MIKTRPFLAEVQLKPTAPLDSPDFPFSLPVVRALQRLPLHPGVTFLVGENGSGKSTLLEAIAVGMGFNAEGGSRNFNFATRASHSALHEHLRLVRGVQRPRDGFFLRAESFYNVSSEIERLGVQKYYGDTPMHDQSHGEAFLTLFMHRFGREGFYVLDEPEAALSPQRQLALLSRLHDLVKQRSQFVIATHSPILMAYPNAIIYECGEHGIRQVAYEDTEHYRVTRDFLANPARMLKVLMDEA
ncbi:AAA family ATPase [Massilia yuzhufengensis]|uniref:Predicted ATPase n=1 Tax=Massilia yuzhufengensis TaxID=1164594 RepID=A0A1I1TB73_9BURK|nr:AAA family ATPase [Massilia yuzhufengensis]SFD55882.1 Predicted ATPase [Massilia yuzhufengensis]